MAGLSDQGLEILSLVDVINNLKQRAREIYADQVASGDVVNTDDNSALGRLIGVVSPSAADLWELSQQVYDAFNPNASTGVALDNLVQHSGISRLTPSYTTADCMFSGNNGVLVSAGSVVKAQVSGKEFTCLSSIGLTPSNCSGITIQVLSVQNNTTYSITYQIAGSVNVITYSYISDGDATGAEILAGLQAEVQSAHPNLVSSVVGSGATATLVIDKADIYQGSNFTVSTNLQITKCKKIGVVQANELGVIEQEANTINQIVTPILGWDSVTNPFAATAGRLEETDEELRERFRNTKFERSSNILDSLYSALNNLDGVTEVTIYENDTNVTDGNGVLPHSFLPVVLGGIGSEIAQTIWENKPMGILSQGNTVVSILDSQGFPHDIGFERPNPVTVYIELTITTDPILFPATGEADIRNAIIDYAQANFGVGDDVVYSRLYTPINSVVGHQVDSLYIGTSPSPVGIANIPIDFNEIGSFESVNISIITS